MVLCVWVWMKVSVFRATGRDATRRMVLDFFCCILVIVNLRSCILWIFIGNSLDIVLLFVVFCFVWVWDWIEGKTFLNCRLFLWCSFGYRICSSNLGCWKLLLMIGCGVKGIFLLLIDVCVWWVLDCCCGWIVLWYFVRTCIRRFAGLFFIRRDRRDRFILNYILVFCVEFLWIDWFYVCYLVCWLMVISYCVGRIFYFRLSSIEVWN